MGGSADEVDRSASSSRLSVARRRRGRSWGTRSRASGSEWGVLLPAAADDVAFQTWVGAFLLGLAVLGWTIGRNVRIDTRWPTRITP